MKTMKKARVTRKLAMTMSSATRKIANSSSSSSNSSFSSNNYNNSRCNSYRIKVESMVKNLRRIMMKKANHLAKDFISISSLVRIKVRTIVDHFTTSK